MFKKVCLAAAVAALASVPAIAADTCGTGPVAPAIPGASDLSGKTTDAAHDVILAALKDVKSYQGALQPFYNCVETQNQANTAALADAKAKSDKSKADQIQDASDALTKNYDKTVSTEKQVVADYMKLHDAYCAMGDGLKGCPKK